MLGWIETRLSAVEQRIEYLIRQVADLTQQTYAAAQAARNAFSQTPNSATPMSGAFQAYPSAIINAGSSASLTVYQNQAGANTSIGTFTVYNTSNSPTVAGNGTSTYPLFLVPDGQGNFIIYDQGCN